MNTATLELTSFHMVARQEHSQAALHKYQHDKPTRPKFVPHNWTPPSYGQRIKYVSYPDATQLESTQDITRMQGIVGTLLYNEHYMDTYQACPSALAS
jgi:hypothetical protein